MSEKDTMNALLLKAPGELSYCQVPRPSPGKGEILVRVKACGICGSDVHGMDGKSGRRIPPLIMGHEAAGIVAEVGEGVERFKEGDRVTFDSTVWCGSCSFCRSGRLNLCENRCVLGVSTKEYRRDGAFADYLVVPEHIVFPLPSDLTFQQAALLEPLTVAYHAVHRAEIKVGEKALVVGAGVIGLLILQVLKLRGPGKVFVLEKNPKRREIAEKAGFEAFAPEQIQLLRKRLPEGADVVFEAVGTEETVLTSISSVKKGGKCILVGNLSPHVQFPLQSVVTGELDLLGSCASSGEWPTCIELVSSRKIDPGFLISAEAPLSEGAKWFSRLREGDPDLLKVILIP